MSRYAKSTNAFILSTLGWIVTLAFVMTPFASAQRTRLKPGMNFFTPQQDVELGLQVSKDAEKKLTMLNNQRVDDYLNRLGKRLAAVAPDGGIVGSGNSSALAYGATMAIFTPRTDNLSSVGLKEATNQLIEDLRSSNSGMRIAKDQGKTKVGGKAALSKILTNDSPVGGRETDWLVTVLRPEGLVHFVFVAPEQEFSDYQRAFQQILNSISFSN